MRAPFLLGLLIVASPLVGAETALPTDRWAADMAKFEKLDKQQPTPPGGAVFVGSSSIRMWDLAESFPKKKPLNRGFGGSELEDSVRHIDLLVLRHKPRVVVLYAGDNDVKNGKSPEKVEQDFKEFVANIRKELPKTKIVYIAIKPSIARWNLGEMMQQANSHIKKLCDKDPNCEFVDIWPAMLDEKGKPRPELYLEDGLHLTPEGYAVWNELVGPHLE